MTKLEKMSKAQLIDEIRRLRAGAAGQTASGKARRANRPQAQVDSNVPGHALEKVQPLDKPCGRYADLYHFSPAGYLTLDKNGRVQEINRTGASMLGMKRSDVVGKLFSSFLADAGSQTFQAHLRQAFLAVGNIISEVKIVGAGGAPLDVRLESAVVRQRKGRRSVCYMVMSDTARHKLTAWSLQDHRCPVLGALNDAIPAPVYFKDRNLRYVIVNQEFAESIGLAAEQIVGKTDMDLFPLAVARNFQHSDREVLNSGEAIIGLEQRFKDRQGRQHWRSTSKAQYRGQLGQIDGVVGVSMDVAKTRETERRNIELLKQNRWLTRRMFSVQEKERRLIARELHDELGQWLTAILADAEAISNSGEIAPDSRLHAAIRAINDSANQIYQVLHRIVDSLRPSVLDELGLVDSLRDLVLSWRKSHPDIACELDVEGNFDDMAEFQRITAYRVVQEALTNVAKHARASHVGVRLHRVPGGRGKVSDILQMSIQDDGKGIDPSVRKPRGLGMLGMRERVIAAGGEFNVDSTKRGTRIDVALRVSERRKAER